MCDAYDTYNAYENTCVMHMMYLMRFVYVMHMMHVRHVVHLLDMIYTSILHMLHKAYYCRKTLKLELYCVHRIQVHHPHEKYKEIGIMDHGNWNELRKRESER